MCDSVRAVVQKAYGLADDAYALAEQKCGYYVPPVGIGACCGSIAYGAVVGGSQLCCSVSVGNMVFPAVPLALLVMLFSGGGAYWGCHHDDIDDYAIPLRADDIWGYNAVVQLPPGTLPQALPATVLNPRLRSVITDMVVRQPAAAAPVIGTLVVQIPGEGQPLVAAPAREQQPSIGYVSSPTTSSSYNTVMR